MSNIYKAFENKKAFIPFITAGDPSLEDTYQYILDLEEAGADLIEIGIPFSDPTAEGPVIQEANIRSLKNKTKVEEIFNCIKRVRKITKIPIIILTYANPVFSYGYDNFFAKCKETGIDGVLCPEIPYEEKLEYLEFAKKYNIDIISMISPTTEDRIKKIAKEATGFIYVVSSLGVTGTRKEITTDLNKILDNIKSVTDVPCAVGFGINTPQQAKDIYNVADGVIVGSAIVKIIEKHKNKASKYLKEYTKSMCYKNM